MLRTILSAAVLALAAGPLLAQSDPVWVALVPGTPEGTEATVQVQPGSPSDAGRTVVEVFIRGFWRTDVVGDDGVTYQRLEVPGLPVIRQPGLPELPIARFALGVTTTADVAELVGVETLSSTVLPFTNVYPAPIPGSDDPFDPTEDPGPGDTAGTPDVFTKDAATYASFGAWPTTPSAGPAFVEPLAGDVPGAVCEVYPLTFEPLSSRLFVKTHVLYTFSHAGADLVLDPLTKKSNAALSSLVVNAQTSGIVGLFDPQSYDARYLIVTTPNYVDELAFFAFVKKVLGYQVEIRTPSPMTVENIDASIEDWYSKGSPQMDHFALLVGDTNTLPTADLAFIGQTDDVYGNVDGDAVKEISVGRLSIDSTADLQRQLQKILDYEFAPVPAGAYDRVVLVAHDEDAPFKYTAAHAAVANASYSVPPLFDLQFGFFGASDSSVRASINAGAGLVAYRGHGSSYSWTDWNPLGQDFHKNDVSLLGNDGDVLPIVWSFACTNGNIAVEGGGTTDCLGESWLENENIGGVAFYGATDLTLTAFNHDLDATLFKQVWDNGIVVHGQALDFTETLMTLAGWTGKDAARYLLLGDPSMTIRRDRPDPISFVLTIPPGFGATDGGESFDISIDALQAGLGLGGAQVSLYKASAIPGAGDELLTNTYTGDGGRADFVLTGLTPGVLHWSIQDGLGNIATGEVEVPPGAAWELLDGGAPGVSGTPRLTGIGTLEAFSPVRIILTDAAPAAPVSLVAGFSELNAPFKGGVLVPTPDVVLSGFSTDGDGALVLPAAWPTGFPPGFSTWFQAWVVDGAAPKGLAGSNGLVGTTP